jgi:two-component sensor histidine kinase
MVLHELATNAVKYGALAGADGRFEIGWDTDIAANTASPAQLTIHWQEISAEPITPPDHEGFGTRFIRRSVEHELDGSSDFAFRPNELRCEVKVLLPLGSEGGCIRAPLRDEWNRL